MLSPVTLFLVGWFISSITQKRTEWISKNLNRGWVPAQNTLIHFCVNVDKGTDLGVFIFIF